RRDELPRLGNRRSRKHRTSARRVRWARRSALARTGGRPPAVTRAPKPGRGARGPWDAASSSLLLHAVMRLNHTILEALDGVQLQGHVTMTPRYQWDAVPDENRDHTDDELVDLPAKQLRVNRPHEGVHPIETFWCRAGRQPFEIAVGTRDIAVRAGRDVDDDFATVWLQPCVRRHALKNSAANLVPPPHPEA